MSDLDKHRYILLGTRKRDGSFVDTPVWFAKDGDTVYMFSAGDAGKVKRLRNFSEARLAPCTFTGKALGEAQNATATLINDEKGKREAYQRLLKKYRWQMRVLNIGARLGRRINSRAFIKATLG